MVCSEFGDFCLGHFPIIILYYPDVKLSIPHRVLLFIDK